MTTAWFDDDQSRMSPDELATVVFPTSRLGRRGYEEGPVREFLTGVQAEFVRLLNERTSLWQEVQRLRRRIIAGQTDGDGGEDSVLFGAEDAHVHAVRILSTAQVQAEKYVADAAQHEPGPVPPPFNGQGLANGHSNGHTNGNGSGQGRGNGNGNGSAYLRH